MFALFVIANEAWPYIKRPHRIKPRFKKAFVTADMFYLPKIEMYRISEEFLFNQLVICAAASFFGAAKDAFFDKVFYVAQGGS